MNYFKSFYNLFKKKTKEQIGNLDNLKNQKSMNEHTYTLSDDLSIEQLEDMYHNIVLSQEFYNDSYGCDWEITPYTQMANILGNIFSPKRHLDIGCGKGLLVQALRNLDYQSYGIDFSQALINQADKSIQDYLITVSAENWLQKAALETTDLITFTEVFEHLPISILEQNLKNLAELYNGKLFLTIPSFGLDSIFKLGIKVSDENQQWVRDMTQNIIFKNIVLEDGLPHHGHITLASYRWWTEFLLYHGYSRQRDLEKYCVEKFGDVLRTYNWNPYILDKTPKVNELSKSLETGLSLSDGWHNYESFGGRWTDGFAKLYFSTVAFEPQALKVELSTPEINYIQQFNLLVTIENLVKTNSYNFKWIPQFSSDLIDINASRSIKKTHTINLVSNFKNNVTNYTASHCWRLNLISPHFCPHEYHTSEDSRRLGIAVHSLEFI